MSVLAIAIGKFNPAIKVDKCTDFVIFKLAGQVNMDKNTSPGLAHSFFLLPQLFFLLPPQESSHPAQCASLLTSPSHQPRPEIRVRALTHWIGGPAHHPQVAGTVPDDRDASQVARGLPHQVGAPPPPLSSHQASCSPLPPLHCKLASLHRGGEALFSTLVFHWKWCAAPLKSERRSKVEGGALNQKPTCQKRSAGWKRARGSFPVVRWRPRTPSSTPPSSAASTSAAPPPPPALRASPRPLALAQSDEDKANWYGV